MEPFPVTFDPSLRERYRNPPAPPGFKIVNPPDIVKKIKDDDWIGRIDWAKLEKLGIFTDPDPTIYDTFVLNTDSEDDDIIEVPVEPIVKDIESICLSDDDDDKQLPQIPLDAKKEKEEKKTKDVENTEQTDKKQPAKAEKDVDGVKEKYTEKKIEVIISREVKETDQRIEETIVKSTEQRTSKKPVDKAPEDVSEKRRDECIGKTSAKTEKHIEKKSKRDDKETKHKRNKYKSEASDSDKRKKYKQYTSYDDSDMEEIEERPRRKEKKHHFSSHSDDSEKMEERPRRRLKKHQSHSPSYDYREDYKRDYSTFKQEYDDNYMYPDANVKEEYPSLHGNHHCEICNLTLNSYTTYQSHITGKRHKKNLDARNVAQSVAKLYVPTKPTSKCPQPPPGFQRVQSSSPAKIQQILDDKLTVPCPGLHKVLEIQGISETSYYCSLCDAPCSFASILPHLNGFKHQLNCLKKYNNKLYEEINYKSKYLIEELVTQKLRAVEKKIGRGKLKVEVDIIEEGTYDHRPSTHSTSFSQDQPSTSRPSTYKDQPSTSKQGSLVEDFSEKYLSCSVPDPAKSGWYCKLCDSHSNSKAMWDAHISGKRHIANVKKAPGSAPSKSRNVPAPPGTIPRLFSQLEYVNEPIVGLDQIREILKLDIDSVSYTCFLCAGCIGENEIVDHIVSRKHREKYLEKIGYPELKTLRNCQMSELALHSLIAEMCQAVEEELGRGEPEVYYAKNSLLKM